MPKNLSNCQLSVNSIATPEFKSGGRKVRKTRLFQGFFPALKFLYPHMHLQTEVSSFPKIGLEFLSLKNEGAMAI